MRVFLNDYKSCKRISSYHSLILTSFSDWGLEKSSTPDSSVAPGARISSCLARSHGSLLSSHFSRFEP